MVIKKLKEHLTVAFVSAEERRRTYLTEMTERGKGDKRLMLHRHI